MIIETKLLRETEEHMISIKKNLKKDRDRQKHYADSGRGAR